MCLTLSSCNQTACQLTGWGPARQKQHLLNDMRSPGGHELPNISTQIVCWAQHILIKLHTGAAAAAAGLSEAVVSVPLQALQLCSH